MAHMIEKNDTMFSVREKPWHYAETSDRCRIIQEAPNSQEALIAAGLNWDVLQSDAYMENGILVPHTKVNYRLGQNGEKLPLGIVSDRYKIVQNAEAFSFTDSIIGDNVRYETAGSMNNGRRVWMLAKMPTTTILGDEVEPYMCFTNSHDGKGAVQVCMTPIRVVCNNTLNLALSSAKRSWSTKHVGDLESKMEEAKMCLGLANTYMDALSAEAERLVAQAIDMKQINHFFDLMYPVKENDGERKKENLKKIRNDFYKCYIASDISQFFNTAYGAINAMADMVDHTPPARNSKNFEENRWGEIMNGHALLDAFTKYVNEKVCV